MSSIPGMSDGRAFGLSVYLPNSELNSTLKKATQVKSENEYRKFIQQNGELFVATMAEQMPVPPKELFCPPDSQ